MAETTPTQDITQQATAPTPKTKPAKNLNRVAAGEMVAERTRRARQAQNKAAEEANAIIAARDAPVPQAPADEVQPVSTPEKPSLTTTQWLAIGSLVVSLIGLYYKREEIKNVLSKKNPAPPPQALPPQPQAATRGLRNMD